LAQLPKDERRDAWCKATELAEQEGNREPTAKHVAEVVREMREEKKKDATINLTADRLTTPPEYELDAAEQAVNSALERCDADDTDDNIDSLADAVQWREEAAWRAARHLGVPATIQQAGEDLRSWVDRIGQAWYPDKQKLRLLPALIREVADEIEDGLDEIESRRGLR
jgi:hypothetical protein